MGGLIAAILQSERQIFLVYNDGDKAEEQSNLLMTYEQMNCLVESVTE